MRRAIWLVASAVSALAQPLEESREIKQVFAGKSRIEVDNVTGSIRVRGYDGQEIRMTAKETFRGESKEAIGLARKEVKLDIREDAGTLSLVVDGPFRRGDGGRRGGCCGEERPRKPRYEARYDFDLEAPRGAYLSLRTVNRGEIRVEGSSGDFDVENVNGAIEMLEVSGSGKAYSLNRPLKVVFRRNPERASCFGSLNGQVELYFQPDLAADFRMKTFNGKIYTDFPITPLPALAPVTERREGKFIYRADRYSGGRVGRGGVEIKLDGFNGDMRILRRIQ